MKWFRKNGEQCWLQIQGIDSKILKQSWKCQLTLLIGIFDTN